MMKRPKYFLPFVIYDENDDIVGIREDAPEEAKQEFKEYMEFRKFAEENDIDY